jgi:hypothetical protein
MHWNEEENKERTTKWHELQARSKERIGRIINNDLTGTFGLGQIRNLDEYKDLSGIDIRNRKIVDEDKAYTFKKLYEMDWQQTPKKKNFLW